MLAIDVFIVTLRIIHIVTGVIWVGSLFVVVFFVQPSASKLGAAGGPFMSELRRRRFVDVVFIDAVFTVVAGAFLYWHDWHADPGFADWIGSSFGAWLTAGALLAISGLIVAASVTRPTIGRLVSLGKQVAESGGTPPPEKAAQIGALQHRLVVAERVSFSLVLLAVVAMASARYL
ncbi:MAG: hypothetical protein OEV60_10750 [Actinomycetota bacterium]|nr:hypothetical protein [Actinomycetota bacterium]MDH5224581.1 hypothetical protein [Actinomycetota bacterium]